MYEYPRARMHLLAASLLDQRSISRIQSRNLPGGVLNSGLIGGWSGLGFGGRKSRSASESGGSFSTKLALTRLGVPVGASTTISENFGIVSGSVGNALLSLGFQAFSSAAKTLCSQP